MVWVIGICCLSKCSSTSGWPLLSPLDRCPIPERCHIFVGGISAAVPSESRPLWLLTKRCQKCCTPWLTSSFSLSQSVCEVTCHCSFSLNNLPSQNTVEPDMGANENWVTHTVQWIIWGSAETLAHAWLSHTVTCFAVDCAQGSSHSVSDAWRGCVSHLTSK